MPAAVFIDKVSSPGRGGSSTVSKLSRALSKLNLRSPVEPDTHRFRTDQYKPLKEAQSSPKTIICHVTIPFGLSKARARDYISSISITSKGNAFLPQYSEIVPEQLFISDHFTGTEMETLERLRITHIVSILHAPDVHCTKMSGIKYHEAVVPKEVYREEKLVAIIEDMVDFIDRALRRRDGRVLIHCRTGVDWSAGVAIAWLMRNRFCEYKEAKEIVEQKREVIELGRDLETGVKQWEGLESARPYFPLGRGGRLDLLSVSSLWPGDSPVSEHTHQLKGDVILDIR